MKPVLAFIFHLVIATLTIPMLALLISSAIVYPMVRRIAFSTSPQRFYSDHLFLLVFTTGLWVGYLVCDTFTKRSAVWVWIPALIALVVRVLMWHSTGSVLFHSSVVEHFFTRDCQIQNWRDTDFASQCGDKLFFMQVIIGTIGYSVGAAIQRMVELRRRSDAGRPNY